MSIQISSVQNSTQTAPAAATQPPPPKEKSTEKPASGQALAQDSVKISSAGQAASQAQSTQKSSGDVGHDGDSK
jgi:hypothetical protein